MAHRRTTNSPLTVKLLLTRNCNLKCDYCSAEQFVRKEKEPELSTKEWLQLLEKLKTLQIFSLQFSGGEIFLRDDIFHILEKSSSLKFPKISIFSNGTLIDHDVAELLKKLKLKDIELSLDGPESIHNDIRGTGAYSKTVRAIEYLLEHDITPLVKFTPLKKNYKSLPMLVDVLYSIGIRRLGFNSFVATGRSAKVYQKLMLEAFSETDEFLELIKQAGEKHPDFRVGKFEAFYKNLPAIFNSFSSKAENLQPLKLKPCTAAHSSCAITSSGWVIPCSELFDFKGGNIRDGELIDIWQNSSNFKRIRELSNFSTAQIEGCRDCRYNTFCNAGCRANSHSVFGNIMASDPFCPFSTDKRSV